MREVQEKGQVVNLVRKGRMIIFLLPYTLIIAGFLVAAKVAGSASGDHVAVEALAIAGVGAVWGVLRGLRVRRRSASPSKS